MPEVWLAFDKPQEEISNQDDLYLDIRDMIPARILAGFLFTAKITLRYRYVSIAFIRIPTNPNRYSQRKRCEALHQTPRLYRSFFLSWR